MMSRVTMRVWNLGWPGSPQALGERAGSLIENHPSPRPRYGMHLNLNRASNKHIAAFGMGYIARNKVKR